MSNLSKNIVFQYFSGTASVLQRKMIGEWLQDDANKEIFYQWLEEWEKEHIQFEPDIERAAKRVFDFGMVEQPDKYSDIVVAKLPPQKSAVVIRSKFVLIAASILLLLISSYMYFRVDIHFKTYKTGFGEIKQFTLSDRSRIVLNANSKLLVPRWGFEDGDRRVELTGEAAFAVTPTSSRQKFLVLTNGQLGVEVIGTEFSVYSRNGNDRIILKEGSVKVHFKGKERQPFLMKPGDVASIKPGGDLLLKHQQPANNFIAWKDHRFVFDSTSLADVIHAIREFFGDEIILEDKQLSQKSITGSFRAESSREILSILSEMYEVELYERQGSFFLTGKK